MKEQKADATRHQELIALAGERAKNLYDAKKICCAEAVLLTLNDAFGGGLAPEMAVRLGAGFCGGMGGAGCACGSLTGAEMALGLFLAPNLAEGLAEKKFRETSKELHDRFKERYSATCCRKLLQRGKEKQGASCKELTRGGAEIVTELILAHRPELAGKGDMEFLRQRDSKLLQLVKRLFGRKKA
ncbi:MAG: C-GCAxxG-C-C family protein [Desulfobulbaceae bacterium]|nr:C-GCAxxG-C-C family protein [Desulfobulbaceae bacterium]